MKVGELVPVAEHRAAFQLYSLKRIADCCGCYCLTNATSDILYIGQALSVPTRLRQHFDSDKRAALTNYGRVSMVWWRLEERHRISALERGWIELYRLREGVLPLLNRIGAPT